MNNLCYAGIKYLVQGMIEKNPAQAIFQELEFVSEKPDGFKIIQ